MNKKILIMTLVLALSFGTMAVFADAVSSPADTYADLAGITAVEAYELKGDMTFGDLAKEAGFYEDFKAVLIPAKIEMVQAKVDEGLISQEDADEIIDLLSNCDGTQENVLKDSGLFMRFGQGRAGGANRGNGQALNAEDGSGYQNGNKGQYGEGTHLEDGAGYQRGNRGGNGFGRK